MLHRGPIVPNLTFLFVAHLIVTLSPFPMRFLVTAATAITHQIILVPFCFFPSFLSHNPICCLNSITTAESTITSPPHYLLSMFPDDWKCLPPAILMLPTSPLCIAPHVATLWRVTLVCLHRIIVWQCFPCDPSFDNLLVVLLLLLQTYFGLVWLIKHLVGIVWLIWLLCLQT